jgi:hypothetical protein
MLKPISFSVNSIYKVKHVKRDNSKTTESISMIESNLGVRGEGSLGSIPHSFSVRLHVANMGVQTQRCIHTYIENMQLFL